MTNNQPMGMTTAPQQLRDEVLETKKKMVSEQIEKILKENGLALMPFIHRTNSADIAQVALVVDNSPKETSE